MGSVLVVYGSTTGATEGVAEQIGATLRELGHEADVVAAASAPDPSSYDAVLVGSGVRAGNWHAPVKEWVGKHARALADGDVALFTVGMTMAVTPEKAEEVRAYTDPLIEETGITAVDVGLFPGMHEPKLFSLPERLVLKAMRVPRGDFRDMDAVADWTRDVAEKMGL